MSFEFLVLSKKWSLCEYVWHYLTDAQGWGFVSFSIAEGQARSNSGEFRQFLGIGLPLATQN
jgi:hypothetical protein